MEKNQFQDQSLCVLNAPWGAVYPLVVTALPAQRFLSGLTLTSPHCVACTVIHGRVLGSQAAQLHVGCA